jgi:pyridoxamine 5'-phosphate oxidase
MRGSDDPIGRFQELFARAQATEEGETTAAALATADVGGRPSARMVLLKGVDAQGFVFYTNFESRKGRELAANPQAALCFHWQRLRIQVRVEGAVERVAAAESDAYFASRPRGHQLGAWASSQSSPLGSREELLARVADTEARFAGKEVPRPPFWGGFRLRPDRLEFWHAQDDRLHDRLLYTLGRDGWRIERLFP